LAWTLAWDGERAPANALLRALPELAAGRLFGACRVCAAPSLRWFNWADWFLGSWRAWVLGC